jgi:predicted nucleotidyltransferase
LVEISVDIKKSIIKYLNGLENSNIKIEKAILFGSYAKGTNNEWSDIDIALISKNFSGSRFQDRFMLAEPTVHINSSISPLPYRPEDFDPSDLFVKEIMETGIEIN